MAAKQTSRTAKRGRPAKPSGSMDVSLTVKLPSDLRAAANEKSQKTGVSISFVVRKSLEEWVQQ